MLLLVLLRVRPMKAAVFVIGALLMGVLWMMGVAGWLGIKITFLNFIALPFIFGVGVEYAIHVVTEYKEHGSVTPDRGLRRRPRGAVLVERHRRLRLAAGR